ncbi:Gfo/Idh/MocA family protein [Paenibacillus silvisoli]|uniref:Gfo/Idh/MocA family protein n=1 Tax=Paenibacillus silvisoli TaxID=3110539 RepID=UPI002804ED9E|nr:Gfo/Idh/MocA family oxidoreductase [Paenibacillus silvisoli]
MEKRDIIYNFEYDRKLKVCFIGAGGHSFRNVYPTFQYAPVDLLAICDMNGERAEIYAKQFGAKAVYTDYREMLEKEKPEAVFIVTAYTTDGRVQATDIALEALRLGIHVWMEKPTAASVEEIEQLICTSREHNRYVMTGLKKMFFPAIAKVKDIISQPEFGTPSSLYIRYPQNIPPLADRKDLRNLIGFLDHIYHPAAIIHYLMGKVATMSFESEPFNGGSVTNFKFASGAVGTMHMTAGISGSSPLERLEVVGNGCNVVVENGVNLTYYRKASRGGYGRSSSYLVDDESAPLHWEPEFSLGQLYNKNIFLLGYAPEVIHFCERILAGQAPEKGTLEDALEIMKLFEAYRNTPEGEKAVINAN